MQGFHCLVQTPAGLNDLALAIAASRAGGIGVFNAEAHNGEQIKEQLTALIQATPQQACGVKLVAAFDSILQNWLLSEANVSLRWLLLDEVAANALETDWLTAFRRLGGRVLVESVGWREDYRIGPESDGWIVKGHEAGGAVGEDSAFILLQQFLARQTRPVYVRGGIGRHGAAACHAIGAAGVVLDDQVLLLRESPVRENLEPLLRTLVGNETVALGDPAQGQYFRVLDRPDFGAVKALRTVVEQGGAEDWQSEAVRQCGWLDPSRQLLPLGQAAAFAAAWARDFGTVARALQAIERSVVDHPLQALQVAALAGGAPLALAHGTAYPIVQGPMTRVSDNPAFAQAVAEAGALPMLALALLKGEQVRALLAETRERLGERPWGVGFLGFADPPLLSEQIAVACEFQPAFAIIAGGRPGQALDLEAKGIPSYLHVPSPRLLTLFLEQGARRFIFEGRECGGHIGPLASLVLWENMVESLLAYLPNLSEPGEIHLLFAGGIHDQRSAALVAVLAAPLTAQDVRIGVLLGSAYLFTPEIVASGAITPAFQQAALECQRTVNLETGPGHASRCVATPFAEQFFIARQQLREQGLRGEALRLALEQLNLGRLRLASKGQERDAQGQLRHVSEERQRQEGMYMIGQAATLRDTPISLAELHHAVSDGVQAILREHIATHPAPMNRPPAPADIAIIGIGVLLPGANDVRQYWENILDQVSAIREIPPHRWDWRRYFAADRQVRDKIYSRWGGFLDDQPFDPLRYGLPPNSLKSIDPLQLLTLETVRQALADAGYADGGDDRERVSVILGASGGAGDVGVQYAMRSELPRFLGELPEKVAELLPEWSEDTFAGILLNVAAGRVSNRFDFGGVNFTVDAACASSLAAVYQGVVELVDGRSDLVLTGGVDTVQGPFGYLCFSKTQALSPRGCCQTFDADSDGIVISEGLAVVALKRLADAYRDGDRIYAVIKGVGGSSDGRAKALSAPHPAGQMRALQRAYAQAGYSPASVGLFEAHGTGTVAGDSAELETVTRVLRQAGAGPRQAAIGSVKTLIGHTKATAGIAGLVKAALALYHRTLPAHPGVQRPNPQLADPASPLYLTRETQSWLTAPDQRRRAGVSAFGFGGTDFHVTLEEYRDPYQDSRCSVAHREQWPLELLCWRAADEAGLLAALQQLRAALEQGAEPALRDLAYTLALELKDAPDPGCTLTLIVATRDELLTSLSQVMAHWENSAQPLPPNAGYRREPLALQGKVAVLFSGQGSQYPGMLRELALLFPALADGLTEADTILADEVAQYTGGQRLSQIIYPPSAYDETTAQVAAATLTRTELAQPALGAVGIGLWALWRQLGGRADLVAGHSYGEYLALYAAGVLDRASLLRVSQARGRFIMEAAADGDLGGMLAVTAPRETVQPLTADYPELVLANHNAPRQSVLSGPRLAIQAASERLAAEKMTGRILPVAAAFHSPLMAPAQAPLTTFIAGLTLHPATVPVYSNTTAQLYPEAVDEVRRILAEHLLQPVEFVAEIEAMYQDGARLFVELGPKTVLKQLTEQILRERPHRAVAIDDRGGGLPGLLHALATLLAEGVTLDLTPLFQGRSCQRLDRGRLVEATRPPPLSPYLWMLNGSSARPAGAPAVAREMPLVRAVDAAAVAPDSAHDDSAPRSTTTGFAFSISPTEEGDKTFMADSMIPPRYALEGGQEAVMSAYHDTMRRFLETQEAVMVAYLTGAPPVARPVATLPSRPALPAPVLMSPPVASLPEPLPQVAPVPPPPVVKPEPPSVSVASPVSAPTGAIDRDSLTRLLLGIVAEHTGYPPDMLGLEQDMEADLGIDSIKRVEIVGALLKALPPPFDRISGREVDALSTQRTLAGILNQCYSIGGGPEAARPFEQTGVVVACRDRATLPRFLMQARLETVAEVPLSDLEAGIHVLTGEDQGVVAVLRERLRQWPGIVPVLLEPAILADGVLLRRALADHRRRGTVRGLWHLAALSSPPLPADADLNAWRRQTAVHDKALFLLLRELGKELRFGGRVLAASALGGCFGRMPMATGFHAQGGAVGLLKALHEEWPNVCCKAVDVASDRPDAEIVEQLLTEFRLPGGRIEVGYPAGQRTVFATVPAPLIPGGMPLRIPQADWVVLATGGARGITAEVLRGLAGYGLRLVLVGRSPTPGPEPVETAGLPDAAALRHYFVQQARMQGQPPRPSVLEQRVRAVLHDREIAANLRELVEAGARVEYQQVDVADPVQLAGLLADLYQRYGRLDGVIHGAGLIEDGLLLDKSPASWARVFDTKSDSAFLLARWLDPATLKFLAFFTSVAGRYGNSGQTDYAAGNELVNRLAWQLHWRWGDQVKVMAINWGPWAAPRHGPGMVTPEAERKFAALGVGLVEVAAGTEFFLNELGDGPLDAVELIAGVGPWEQYEAERGAWTLATVAD
jgi:acyl transferase domain-containing protein/NAD(P)H-dependent flavin oxidoreductase YrpB (nitropropane dioxygenase family)/NAD(P)-dependent dehydrogenase (short-subunit alcohol dehydrogenase family)